MKNKRFFMYAACMFSLLMLFSPIGNRAAEAGKKPALLEGKININTASAKELSMLSGIGKKTAENMIKYRTQNGQFKSTEEIRNIKGIGEKTLDLNRKYLAIEGKTTLKMINK